MNSTLSASTQATLLLTAPLIAGRSGVSPDLLTLGEFKRLARRVQEVHADLGELVSQDSDELLRECRSVIEEERLRRLLGRGFLLTQAVEHWHTRAIWVVGAMDDEYPQRVKDRLKEDAPPVLYGCGDDALLSDGGLAVVGSRNADPALIDYTMEIGHLCARAGKVLVSGGARGIDQAAMRGALEAGGSVIGVLADSLERNAMQREHRSLLLDDRLVFISPYDPSAGFNVGNAMQRNKLIYALAEASLVVSSDYGKGGTWAGAIEQLDKLRLAPLYVRSTGEMDRGLGALRQKGALPWPNPQERDSFMALFEVTLPSRVEATIQPELPLIQSKSARPTLGTPPESSTAPDVKLAGTRAESPPAPGKREPEPTESPEQPDRNPADILFDVVRDVLTQLLQTPKNEEEVAAILLVAKRQAKEWLQRLADEAVIEKRTKPLTYVVKQARLFKDSDKRTGAPK